MFQKDSALARWYRTRTEGPWGWGLVKAGTVAGAFLVVDCAFFAANMAKFIEGGYVPLLLACAVYTLMWIWHRGASAVHDCIQEASTPLDPLLQELESGAVPRVPGSAVFFTRSAQGVPPVLNWHLKHNRSLHESLLLIRLSFALTPRVARENGLAVTQLTPNFWRADVSYGFMETADIPQLLADARVIGCNINRDDVTYYVGHDTIVSRADGRGLPGLADNGIRTFVPKCRALE